MVLMNGGQRMAPSSCLKYDRDFQIRRCGGHFLLTPETILNYLPPAVHSLSSHDNDPTYRLIVLS